MEIEDYFMNKHKLTSFKELVHYFNKLGFQFEQGTLRPNFKPQDVLIFRRGVNYNKPDDLGYATEVLIQFDDFIVYL